MVRRIAGDLGYAPNRAAKALRFNHDPKRIGVILPVASSEFFGDIVDGIHRAEDELHDMGIETEISIIDCADDSLVANTLEYLAEDGVAGVITTGPDTPRVREAIDALSSRGIPVVTINSDIGECSRLCFVGQDLRKSGLVAAELMAKLVAPLAPGRILAVTGNLRFQAHRDRIVGFREGIEWWDEHLVLKCGKDSTPMDAHRLASTRRISKRRRRGRNSSVSTWPPAALTPARTRCGGRPPIGDHD